MIDAQIEAAQEAGTDLGATYAQWDRELIAGGRRFDRPLFEQYLAGFQDHPRIQTVVSWKARSMLSVETLLLMRAFALEARGAILEIGAYVGGGTLALADGAQAAGGKPIVTIEVGGAHDHPTMPSQDIVADWRKTQEAFGVAGVSSLVVGWANTPAVAQAALGQIGDTPIGLVVIDANGMPHDNIHGYREQLSDDCLFVIDDYCNLSNAEDNSKFALTREGVDSAVRAGALIEYGVAQWGTWFGRRGPAFLDRLDEARRDERRRAGWTT